MAPSGLTVEVFESGTSLIKWQPLTAIEARGNVVGYRVSISRNNITNIQGTQNPWLEVHDLIEGHLYTVKVAGVSGGGVGPWSSPELVDIASISSNSKFNYGSSNNNTPSVFYAPPHPGWLLYLLVPLIVLIIIITLIYIRKMRYKSAPTLDTNAMGPALYSSAGVYTPSHQVNMYGEQKIWRLDSDQDSSLSSARLIHQEHLANEYAEPKIQQLPDDTEPYATTALLTPSSPHIGRTPPAWRNIRRKNDIQVNWNALIPPPPSCPPPLNFPLAGSCSSGGSSDRSTNSDRRRYHTGSSTPYENAGGVSEEYERPFDFSHCEVRSEHPYAVFSQATSEGPRDRILSTFNNSNSHQMHQLTHVDLKYSCRAVSPKNNTH